MTIMLGKLYTGLKAAGAPDDEARAAAEEVGDLHDQFAELRTAMHELRTELKDEIHGLRLDADTNSVWYAMSSIRN
jgi:hypothetical protein